MEELSLHILDIVENSVSAGATLVEIRIEYRFGEKPWLTITVRDNGRGMSPEVAGRVSDPFYTTRDHPQGGTGDSPVPSDGGTGRGELPGVVRAGQGHRSHCRAQSAASGRGAHGDLGGTYGVLVQTSPGVELVLHAVCDGREFTADTRQFREILGDVPLDTPEVIAFLTEFVRENFAEILRGSPLA